MWLHLEGERALEQESIAFLRPTRVGRRSDHGTDHTGGFADEEVVVVTEVVVVVVFMMVKVRFS